MPKISRRGFMKSALAISILPLTAQPNEKNKKSGIKFIHITDTHMDMDDGDTIDAMELMVDFINENYKDLDFILFGGDNFNNNVKKKADAFKFKEIIDTLHCPSYLVRGNKESSQHGEEGDSINLADFRDIFLQDSAYKIHGRDWLVEKNGYNILGLDSCIENANNGLYTQETLQFAENILKSNKPTIILNHHIYTNFWGETKKSAIHNYVLNNTKEVQKRLFAYPNLIMTLSGHKHIDSVTSIMNTKVIATRGFVRPLDLDMFPMRYVEIEDGKINEKLIYTS